MDKSKIIDSISVIQGKTLVIINFSKFILILVSKEVEIVKTAILSDTFNSELQDYLGMLTGILETYKDIVNQLNRIYFFCII